MAHVAVIYYSATGNVYALARAVAEGAEAAGADVRLRRVREIAPPETVARNPKWVAHLEATKDIPEATLDDLDWANAAIFGSPARFSNVTYQLKRFIDEAGALWMQGRLAGKVVSGFTSASTPHGGHESALIAMYNSFYNWGGIIVPPGYADPVQYKAGTPFGATHMSGGGAVPGEIELASARFQGRRVAEVTATLVAGGALLRSTEDAEESAASDTSV
ncbi:MAG TPA: NAD(P)H:quinone oxidoreductase [Gemmatimonadales bacterium]|nr:NAD(P)H:quinone oxidoreductase [Gemmatimonadales bacterium]